MSGVSAAAWLRERQQKHPPWDASDRGHRLLQLMRARLPRELDIGISNGSLAAGEVGTDEPAARMTDLGSAQFAVEIDSGMFELVNLVTHALFGFTTQHTANGVVQPPLTHRQLVEKIAGIFLEQRGGKFKSLVDYRAAAAGLSPRPGIADALASYAMQFVLAHELGHVIESLGGHDKYPAPRPWAASETYADWLGVRLTLGTQPKRMVYAGVLLAIRVFLYLERLGQTFAGPHPSLDVRFGLIKQMAREIFDHDIDFTVISTIALSYDEMLEGVENYLAGKGHTTQQTVERVRVRLWAMLEERLKGSITHQRLVADVQDALQGVDAATCKEVARTFSEWFSERRSPVIPDPTNGRLPATGGFLKDVIPDMPTPARDEFARLFLA